MLVGFQIPYAVYWIPVFRIPDFTSKRFPDSRFYKSKYLGSRNLDSLIRGERMVNLVRSYQKLNKVGDKAKYPQQDKLAQLFLCQREVSKRPLKASVSTALIWYIVSI